jgi:TusA-related sulfurtransferase
MKLDEMNQGEVLELLADDPAAEEDIKSLIKRTKHKILSISKEENIIKFLIRKS